MNNPMTKAELRDLEASQPAYPPGAPVGWWSAEQLRAYIAHKDAEIAARPQAIKLNLNTLTSEQLARIAACTSAAEYAAVEQTILNNQPLPPVQRPEQRKAK